MNNKTFLVAQREFLENVRTKAFWIGILVVPLILMVAFIVPSWLEGKKSARKYAVVDHSGWLLEAVEQRASMPDLEKVFRESLDRLREDEEGFAELPESLQETARQLDQVMTMLAAQKGAEGEDQAEARRGIERQALAGTASMIAGLGGPEGEKLRSMVPPQAIAELEALRESVRQWWSELPAKEAKRYASGTTKSRYSRVDVEGSGGALIDELNQMVGDEELFAYIVIGEDPIAGNEGARYVSSNLTDDDLQDWFSGVASTVVRERRLLEKEIDQNVARWVQEPYRLESKKIGKGGEEESVKGEDKLLQWAPAAFTYLLWICIFTTAQMLMTNTIEEKSNRIMEVLLSSVSPLQLMGGKIGGIAFTGLTMVSSWVLCFFLAAKFLPRFFDVELNLDLGAVAGNPALLASFIFYFLFGYLLYACLLVGIGSVCNSLKEAQNLIQPVFLLLIVPMLTLIPVTQDPNGTLARVLSFIPPFTPFVMMNRAAGPPTLMEYVLTTIVLLASIAVAYWGAAKIFRIGVLMTGKPPKLKEIFGWVKAPVGQVPERQS